MTMRKLDHVTSDLKTSRWVSIKWGDSDLIRGIQKPVKAVVKIVDTIDIVASLAKTYLNIISKLAVDLLDTEQLALKATIETIRAILEDLTGPNAAAIHAIFFPALPSIDPALTPGLTFFEKNPGSDLNSFLSTPTGKLANVALGIRGTAGGGGNAGFMGQLALSLQDEEDSLRPQYDEDAHVAGVLLYFGSKTFNSLLTLIAKLSILFSDTHRPGPIDEALKSLTLPDFPALKNLRADLTIEKTGTTEFAQKIALSDSFSEDAEKESPPIAVRFSWDTIPSRYFVSPYPDEKGNKVKYKVTDVIVFGDKAPLPLNDPEVMLTKELYRFDFQPFTSEVGVGRFEEPGLWYFAVALAMHQVTAEGPETLSSVSLPLSMTTATTTLYIPDEPYGVPRQGPSPNWHIAGYSPLAMIPGIRDTVLSFESFLDQLEQYNSSKSSEIEQYIEAINAWTQNYISWVQEVAHTVERIITALNNWPIDVFAGCHPFAGKGGNSYMVNEIGKALFDQTDPGRPPFDTGTEAVYGMVLMAGSESAGKIQKFCKLMSMLFNVTFSESGEFTQSGQAAASAIQAAISSIDKVSAQVDAEIAFYDNMQPGAEASATVALPAFDTQLQPSTEAEGCAG